MRTIESLLRERIGLDCTVTGSIQRSVRRRMEALELPNVADYYDRLLRSGAEYAELVESVVVTETWFFRDPEAFTGLARLAAEQWVPQHPNDKFRVLCLPCATGEEPYSIVMALLEAGVPPSRFDIDAIDISERALERARRGLYGKNAFRGKDLAFQQRCFRKSGSEFQLDSSIRRLVGFLRGNLLDPGLTTPRLNYDFIFFRNLLIYLTPEAQRQALQKIHDLLSPRGLVFVGAAEQPIAFDEGFVPAELPLAFACAKGGPPPARAAHACPLPQPALEVHTGREGALPTPTSSPHADLRQAGRLADAGRLTEAAAICEAHLRDARPSAEAYYLLGLVRDAKGDPSAVECYRRALYLEPNHYQALLQLAGLAGKNGDKAGARNLQRRAQRLADL